MTLLVRNALEGGTVGEIESKECQILLNRHLTLSRSRDVANPVVYNSTITAWRTGNLSLGS